MALTCLKRTGKQEYEGMVCAMSKREDWSTPTTLVRFLERLGPESLFSITGTARPLFDNVELWRIYTLEVAGACVKINFNGLKYGIPGPYEVRISYPCKMSLATNAWPAKILYKLLEFPDLNQTADDVFVDIIGKVLNSRDPLGTTGSLPKKIVTLANGDYTQELELLGDKATLQFRVDDVLAVRSACINKWNEVRVMQTGHLTIVEVNPVQRKDIPLIDISDEPKQKAIKMTPMSCINIAQVNKVKLDMLKDAAEHKHKDVAEQKKNSKHEFCVRAEAPLLTKQFFVDDPPLVGPEEQPKVCFRSVISDATGDLEVKIWENGFFRFYGLSSTSLRSEWEKGVDAPSKQEEIRESLNSNEGHSFSMYCTAKLNSYAMNRDPTVEVHINNVEIVEDDI